jgi:hypothetical protein
VRSPWLLRMYEHVCVLLLYSMYQAHNLNPHDQDHGHAFVILWC